MSNYSMGYAVDAANMAMQCAAGVAGLFSKLVKKVIQSASSHAADLSLAVFRGCS